MVRRILIGLGAVLVLTLAAGAFAAGALGSDEGDEPDYAVLDPEQPESGMQRIPAPIEAASVQTPSEGTEYRLVAVAGLPGGCATEAGYDIARDGTTVRVHVYIDVPADDRACTKIYKTFPVEIGLGTDMQSGVEYTVDVNGTLVTFVPSLSEGSK